MTRNYKLWGAHYGNTSFDHSSNICTYSRGDWVIFIFAEMVIQCIVLGANRNHFRIYYLHRFRTVTTSSWR